jgi:hypothetical protein
MTESKSHKDAKNNAVGKGGQTEMECCFDGQK